MSGQTKLRHLRGALLRVQKVEKQTRIRIGKELREVLPWVRRGPVECWMELAPSGGVRLFPEEKRMDPLDQSLASLPGQVFQGIDDETLQYVATRATVWEVPLMYEAQRDRYCFYLPEEARLLKVLPDAGEVAVVLAVQDELHVWSGPEWLAYVREGLTRLETLREAAARVLPLLDGQEVEQLPKS